MPSGECTYCGCTFSTKDGGARCSVCESVACPECEPQQFGDIGAREEMCILCFLIKRFPHALTKLKERLTSDDIVE